MDNHCEIICISIQYNNTTTLDQNFELNFSMSTEYSKVHGLNADNRKRKQILLYNNNYRTRYFKICDRKFPSYQIIKLICNCSFTILDWLLINDYFID